MRVRVKVRVTVSVRVRVMARVRVAGLPLLAATWALSTVKASGQTPRSRRSERALNSLWVLTWMARWSGSKKQGSPG